MSAGDALGRRFDAATGLLAAILIAVGFGLPGSAPTADDSVADITNFFVDKRGSLLAGVYIVGLGMVFYFWFLGSLRSYLRAAEGGEGRLSSTAFGAGVASGVLTIGAAAMFAGISFDIADEGDDILVRALFDVASQVFTAAGFPAAVLIGAASISAARSGALPLWACRAGMLGALYQLPAATAVFVKSGPLAAGGFLTLVALFVFIVWLGVVSVLIYRRGGVPPPAPGAA
jgi:hypothetical protein